MGIVNVMFGKWRNILGEKVRGTALIEMYRTKGEHSRERGGGGWKKVKKFLKKGVDIPFGVWYYNKAR